MKLEFHPVDTDDDEDQDYEVVPPVLHPGKRPEAGHPHWLIVEEHPDDGLTIEHEHACLDQWGEVACDVDWWADTLDDFFHHTGHSGRLAPGSEGLRPGRYLIEAWASECYSYAYGTTEYDGGIALHYPEEAAG